MQQMTPNTTKVDDSQMKTEAAFKLKLKVKLRGKLLASAKSGAATSPASRHPFDPTLQPGYKKAGRQVGLRIKNRQLGGRPPKVPGLSLPQAGAVKPPVVS